MVETVKAMANDCWVVFETELVGIKGVDNEEKDEL